MHTGCVMIRRRGIELTESVPERCLRRQTKRDYSRWALASACFCALIALTGCVSPTALHTAVVTYDKAAAQVQAELLLLNIARARNVEPLHFTALSSVAATFNFGSARGHRLAEGRN